MKQSVLIATLLSAAMATPAFAVDIEVTDFVGKIIITDGNDGVDIVRRGKFSADISENSDRISIDGGLSSSDRNEACKGGGIGWNLDFNGRKSEGNTRLKDYPELRLSVPNGSSLMIRDSYVELDSGIRLGEADLDIGGCFNIKLDAVDTLDMDKSGSGDIEIGEVGTFNLEKSGSGDIEIGRTGPLDIEKSGSGDIEIDSAEGQVTIEKSGSGDIDIDDLVGDFSVDKSGSGDVDIGGGDIPDLKIRNSGSGDVDINAPVGNAYVRASGSGDVYVKSISGSLDSSTSGSSDFKRGDD